MTNYSSLSLLALNFNILRQLILASLIALPISLTGFTKSAAAEDCLNFNPNNTSVKKANGRWKIIEGSSHWMFDFNNNRAEARKSLAVIKHYGLNKSCFVGRPNPSFQYLLKDDSLPVGAMKREDCVTFNPKTTTVGLIQNRWKIVDGNHWIFDFNTNQTEAKQSFEIIQKYQATHSCYVGRPDPSFVYLRR